MTQPPPVPEKQDGMAKVSSPISRVSRELPVHSKPLPMSESEADISASATASTRSSFDRPRASNDNPSLQLKQPLSNEPKEVIVKAFLPRVAVLASQDTEELVRFKGVYGGLCGLLRPFGETVPGKVGIRDSGGLSKSFEDYGIHFVPFGSDQQRAQPSFGNVEDSIQEGDWSRILKATPDDAPHENALDETVRQQLEKHAQRTDTIDSDDHQTPDYYNLLLRKILSQRPLSAHDTFSHPVACVIAISSQTPDPIATLGDLYQSTRAESGNLPSWVNNGFLRYYLLVHDEDHDDLTASTNLFAQMKRHFGLHCHMLRLRSVECSSADPEGSRLPEAHWLDADSDIVDMQQRHANTADELHQYLFDSDAAVIKTFVRELVTQSIVPYMENRVTTWNDQVASRRRGVTGKLMNMSKRWTTFGSTRTKSSSSASSDKDYDSHQGAYKPDCAVATMHKLAGFAFMLRDYRLSSGVYDLLRSDFSDDKAWHHYADAHEMAAVSRLLQGQSAASKGRVESINQLLDTASYSYITRCGSPREATRCMIVAMELYMFNGGAGAKEAPRWGKRLLELSISSQLLQALLSERLVLSFRIQPEFAVIAGDDLPHRRSAFWNLIASDCWTRLGYPKLAEEHLSRAHALCSKDGPEDSFESLIEEQPYYQDLKVRVAEMGRSGTPIAKGEPDTFVEDLAATKSGDSGVAGGHRYTRSVNHRRGPSQAGLLGVVGRDERPSEEADDGFS